MPRSSPTPHTDHHHQHHHHQTHSNAVYPPHIPMHAHSNTIHDNYIAAGQHMYPHALPCIRQEEEIIRDLNHNLIHASLHIEMLEGELHEARREIEILRHENAVLREENVIVRDYLDGGEEDGQEIMRALAERLQNLFEGVQDLNEMLGVVLEEARAVASDEHEPPGSRYYFEGGWEDMARLWQERPTLVSREDRSYTAQDGHEAQGREARPIQHASEPEPGNGLEDMDPSDMAYWFERSGAPSPEERRHLEQTPLDMLRQIENEMAILQLQDRLERKETQIAHLTNRCNAQERWSDLVCGVSKNYGERIMLSVSDIYKMQEDDGEGVRLYCTCGKRKDEAEEEEDDEPYCTCGDGWEELRSADGSTALRGGMGGRDEDEELVYDYGGYTNWDQADEPPQGEDTAGDRGSEIIRELRRQIERLEAQIRTLTEAAHREVLPRPTDPQPLRRTPTRNEIESTAAKAPEDTLCGKKTMSVLDSEEEEKDVNLRGGSGEEESQVDSPCDHANTSFRASIPASPHLLCQRATSRVGESTINYIIVYLPPGFIIPDSSKPELVFHSAATIYYFPTGATEDVVQREAWKQKGCGEGHWHNVDFHKIQSKQVFKSAIANMWEKMGLNWDVLTHRGWNFDENQDQGDMYMVNDNNLFLTNRTREVAGPHIRGGSGDEPIQIPSPIDEDEDSLDEFNRIYESLLDEARMALMTDSPEQQAHAWMTVATTVQWHNSYLERELETFTEMNNSVIQDLHWQMDVQVELEEQLEAAKADKKAMAEDYQDLKTRLASLVETFAAHTIRPIDHEKDSKSSGDGTELASLGLTRGGDEVLQPTMPAKNKSAKAVLSDTSHPYTTITTNSFDFYPRRSTLVFEGSPPHIYQFPCKSTLPEIREILESDIGKDVLTKDQYIARIVEIMKIREEMGIHLPENVRDERITISIADIPTGSHSDRETKVTAWQVSEEDVEGIEELVKKLEIDPNAAKSSNDILTKTTSSEGEKDYYQDVGDLINSLNDTIDYEDRTASPKLCVCQTCSVDGGDTYSNLLDSQSPRVVSVRGGGSGLEYWNHDPHGNREFPLHYPRLAAPANAPPNTPRCYGTIASGASLVHENKEIATSKGPLSMRLGRLMLPPKFVKQRENSIRRFDWQHIKRLSPQFKDKDSRGFRYTREAQCEDWEVQLDKHREHCDYCQTAFSEEGFATKDLSPRHEDDAPEPKIRAAKPWENSTWPGDRNALSFSTVEDPDPRLRGGAGSETGLEYNSEDSEDWRSEWDDLASQTQCSGRQPRTFHNSSTLSTKTTISPPSPVYRGFKPRRWPQESDLCTAEEFIRTGPTISAHESLQMDAPQVRAGESIQPPHYYRFASPNHMTRSKTSHPLLLETRRSRGESVLERPHTRYESFQYDSPGGVSIMESGSVLDLRAENWLENPRPAPPPSKRYSASSSQYSQQSHDVGLIKVYGSECSTRFNPTPREASFRSDRHEFFPTSEYSNLSENTLRMRSWTLPRGTPLPEMLSDGMYEEHVRSRPMKESRSSPTKPRLGVKLCKRCKELLTMLMEYIRKIRQLSMAKRPKKGSSRSAIETPAAPAPSRLGCEAWYMNRGLPPLPCDKSLPPTPRVSASTIHLPCEPKKKFSAAPWASVSIIECAHAIAQAQDRVHADFISQEGNEWHVPTVAGPSDLVKEALMWLVYEAKSAKIGKTVFDRSMRDDTAYGYARSNDWVIV